MIVQQRQAIDLVQLWMKVVQGQHGTREGLLEGSTEKMCIWYVWSCNLATCGVLRDEISR